jgi:hypothetical protein
MMKKYGLLLALTLGGSFMVGSVSAQEPSPAEVGNAAPGIPWLVARPQAVNVAIGPVRVAEGPPVLSVLAIGPVRVEGQVLGDVVSLGGVITCAAGASVGGKAVALGGRMERAEGEKIEVATQLDPTAKEKGIDTSEEENGVLLGLGEVTVPADRTVTLAVAFGGPLTVRGTVTQIAACVGGDVVLEAGSRVQEVCVAGGMVRTAEGAVIQGPVHQTDGCLTGLPWREGEVTPDSQTMGKVNRKVSPNPVMWYNQNRQWVTQNGIRTGMVGTACDLLLVGLGATYRALGDYEKAMSYLQELLKKLPGSVWGRVELGLTQVSLGETEAALQTFREAIQTAPQMWQPRYYLAEACFQKGDLEACQQVLREALELPLDKEAVNRILTLLDRAKGP